MTRFPALLRNGVIATALATSFAAQAVPLLADGSVNPLPGTNEASDSSLTPALGGLVAESETDFSYAAYDGTLANGTISSRVVRRADTGTLDFYWRVTNALEGRARINAFSVFGFKAATYEGDYRNDGFLGGDVSPTVAAIYQVLDQITFSFGVPGVEDDQESNWFFLRSGATNFTAGTMRTSTYNPLAGGGAILSDLFEAYVPAEGNVVSEPATLPLATMALGLALGFRRRRRGC